MSCVTAVSGSKTTTTMFARWLSLLSRPKPRRRRLTQRKRIRRRQQQGACPPQPSQSTSRPGRARGAIASWLTGYNLADDQDRIQLSFGQIEQLIGGKLPKSAREYRSWWANDTARGPQADQWLSAGWRSYEVDLQRGHVTFIRLQDRERAYSRFFESLMAELAHSATFPLYQSSRVGYYWQSVTKMPATSPSIGYITFAFTRARRPRVDLYIDTGDRVRNKHIFDELYAHRNEIDATFGAPLAWERIDDKHASRVAYYYDTPTVIDATPEELTALRQWGVDVILRLHQALEQPTREAIATLDSTPPAKHSPAPTHVAIEIQGVSDLEERPFATVENRDTTP